ncbi:MAG: ScyD/ScyE family protein, partial [Aggregatilineales bacterium]
SRDSGDLSGVPLVGLSPDDETIYIGYFNGKQLWTLPASTAQKIPKRPYALEDLTPAMTRLNNVFLVNPFDMTFSPEGRPVVTDATGNGVAIEQDNGTARFFHRFDLLPDTQNSDLTIEAVPTGITRIDDEYYVTLLGGCPYPSGSGQLVAIDTERNQRLVAVGLNLPIDVAVATDGTVWILEFAQFAPDGSCFTGEGYLPGTGKLSRLLDNGTRETVVDNLDFPGSVLPLPDGSLYITEIFAGRVLHVEFDSPENDNATSQYPQFVNVAEQVGLDFRHGAFRTDIFEDHAAGMGAGLCWLDYDNDGWLDLYLVNSYANAEINYWQENGGLPANRLYHNVEGQFTDVSKETSTALTMRGNGCTAADLNNDGWTDIVITADDDNALLWNNGDGTFHENAAASGINTPDWNSAIAVADLNQDGWLDMFIGSYIDLEKKIPDPIGTFPQDYYGIPDYLYLNTGLNEAGEAVFQDVSREVGIEIDERALGAIFSDFDDDGDSDLYIANDGEPNRLYENIPTDDDIGFRFVDTYDTSNVNDRGSGMGVATGDWTGDGRFDLFVTNWDTELNAIYRNETQNGRLRFFYSTYRIGLRGIGNNMTGWGTAIADFDHDMDMDIMTVNGRVPVTNAALDAELADLSGHRSDHFVECGHLERIRAPLGQIT